MTSQEVGTLTGGFLTQLKGIFSGLEKLPVAFEELQQRERAVAAKEANSAALDTTVLDKQWKSGELDQQIAAKNKTLARIQATVTEQMAAEEQRQRADIEARLAPLRAELDAVTQALTDKKLVLAQLRA